MIPREDEDYVLPSTQLRATQREFSGFALGRAKAVGIAGLKPGQGALWQHTRLGNLPLLLKVSAPRLEPQNVLMPAAD